MFAAIILFVAAFASSVVNAIAGGGTFLIFGALSVLGMPAISANATSAVTQVPGYITSTLAYLADIKRFWRQALILCILSAIGGVLGALLLLNLSNASFRSMVPWLLILATALFAAGPWLKPTPKPGQKAPLSGPPGYALQLVTAIYGGFFGAGMGVMMLATLGLTEDGDYHHLNALKNLLSLIISGIAIMIFVGGGVVSWPQALVMVPGSALGGWAGVWIARRVPQIVVRIFVVAVGLFLAGYYFWTG